MKDGRMIRVGIKFIVLFTILYLPALQVFATPPENTISVGSISVSSKEEIEVWQPFVNYLAVKLEGQGIKQGRMVVAESIHEMADLLLAGEVDLFIDSPFPCAMVCRLSGCRPILRRWKEGLAEFHGVIFVRHDSGINDLEDLVGKMVAFKRLFSSFGYMYPKAMLLQEGYILKKHETFNDSVSPGQIGYIFSNSNEASLWQVLEKKVAAAAFQGDKLEKLSGFRRQELKIIKRSIDVPRHVVCRSSKMKAELVASCEQVMMAMEQDNEGKLILEEFRHTAKFDRFPKGVEATFTPIEKLVSLIEEEYSLPNSK